MKLCGKESWGRVGWLVVVLNLLLFLPNLTYSQNLPPVLDIGVTNQHGEVGSAFSYTIPANAFKDEDNNNLAYNVSGLPAGLTFNPTTRTISGTPSGTGNSTVTVTVNDGTVNRNTNFNIYIHAAGSTYAAFSMNTNIGCGYRLISFSNQSKGATSYNWTLGNGNTSTNASPSAIYDQAGEYTVRLEINGGGAPELVHEQVIRIYPKPRPLIAPIADPGCEPATITLTSSGTPVSVAGRVENGQSVGAISGGDDAFHYWYFFDDHPAVYNQNLPSVNVAGLSGGTYNLLLEVTDENGCQSSRTSYNAFEVPDQPEAHFTFERQDDCNPSLTTFYNDSYVFNSSISQSNWSINGAPLLDHNDTVSYDFSSEGTGDYLVELTTVSEDGCISSVYSETVKFNADNQADFNVNTVYCLSDSIAFNAIVSATATSIAWDIYNDGTTDDVNSSFKHLFNSAGIIPVKLTTQFDDGCEQTIVKSVFIDKALPDFTHNVGYDCVNDEYNVNFQSTSTTTLGNNITSTRWYLIGVGGSETLLSNNAAFNHTFTTQGDKTLRIDIESEDGCTASITRTITLNRPTLTIQTGGSTSGCLSAAGPSNFQALFNSEYETATTYSWSFGDGNNGSGQSVSHTYNTAGSYTVQLSVTTSTGCTYNSQLANAVQLSDGPVINNITLVQDPSQCYSTGVQLDVSYTGGVENLTFNTPSGSENILNPGGSPYSYFYSFPDTGTFFIEVIADQYGCSSSPDTLKNIISAEPKANFTPSQATFCEPPYEVTFNNTSSYSDPATTFSWDFGDGNTSTATSPTHSFGAVGDYNVVLTVSNGTCTDSYSEEINVFSFDDATGIISASNNTGCAPLTVDFTQTITSRVSSNYEIEELLWDFNNDGTIDDTTSASATAQYTYEIPGEYNVRLIVIGREGCNYTFTEDNLVQASGPIVAFSHSPSTVCLNTTVDFNNNSTQPAFDTSTITGYSWDFGDGQTSNLENPSHTYTSDTIFSVSLTVTDSDGCSTTLEKTDLFEIIPFEPSFEIADTVLCDNTELTFTNTSTGDATLYRWDFNGDGTPDQMTTDLSAVTHTYLVPGKYTVELTAVVATGCNKTFSIPIRVIDATPDFSATDQNIGCAPAFAYFTPFAADADVIAYNWNFGDGNSSSQRSPRNYYTLPGVYNVRLTLTFKGGCSKTLEKQNYITVEGAYGEFDYDKTLGCAPNLVLFSVDNMNRVDYIDWDFGTGTIDRDTILNSTTYAEISYAYDTLGYRSPRIILTDKICGEYAYQNDTRGPIYTSVAPVVDFTVDLDSICRGVPIQFTDLSTSPDPLNGVVSWKWYFHSFDNDSSAVKNPKFAYPDQGVYDPELIVSNSIGCADTLVKNDFIHIYGNNLLTADFTVDDDLLCPWQEIEAVSQANPGNNTITKYEWNFGDGFNSGSSTATYTYSDTLKGQTINIYHRVTDDKFCTDSTTRTVGINNLQAAFGYDPQPVFRGSLVDFNDQSVSDQGTAINSWYWNFENASPAVSAQRNPNNIQYPLIDNENAVRLIVTNDNNCSDTALFNLEVLNNPPIVDTFTIVMVENTRYRFRFIEFSDRFSTEDPGQTFDSIRFESIPANAAIHFNGTNYQVGQAIATSQITQLELVPNADWNGSTYFFWNGNDGYNWATASQEVFVTVLEEPDPPLLNDIVYTLPEDSAITITEQDFIDHINSVLGSSFVFDSLQILSNLTPQVGNFRFNSSPVSAPVLILENQINNTDSVFRYNPTNGYNGTLSLSWNAHDGYNFSDNPAQLSITYYNTAPELTDIVYLNIAQGDVVNINKNEFLAHYSDIDRHDNAETLYLTNLPPASEGTFTYRGLPVSNGFSVPFSELNFIRFSPNNLFEGTTSATWGVSDGTDISYALIQFTYINTPPEAIGFNVTAFEDVAYVFDPVDFENGFADDDSWDELEAVSITGLPQHGILYYTTVPVTVPFDISIDEISNLSYIPSANWNGTDNFRYNVFDGTDWAGVDSIAYINVTPVNDPPVPATDYFSTLEDVQLTGVTVRTNDIDIDDNIINLNYFIAPADSATAGENGRLSLNVYGYINFTPNKDFNGSVYFIYTVCDDGGACAKDTAFINVQPVNDAPVAAIDSFFIYEDETAGLFNCLTNDFDVDGDAVTLDSVNHATNQHIPTILGILDWETNGQISFTLAAGLDTLKAGEQVSMSFDYASSDDEYTSSSVFVIVVVGRNDIPIAVDDSYAFDEGFVAIESVNPDYPDFLYNDTDPENNLLTVHTVDSSFNTTATGVYGTLQWESNGNWTYTEIDAATDTLKQGEIVVDEFLYTNHDGIDESIPATITYTITGQNDAPVAENNYLEISEDIISIAIAPDQVEALLTNDYDIDGDNIGVTDVTGINSGTTVTEVGTIEWFPDGSYVYTPDRDTVDQLSANSSITDIFNYTIVDDFGAEASAQLIINIIGENDIPFANNDSITIFEDTHITEVDSTNGLLANDGDIDHDPIVVAVNGVGSRELEGEYGTLSWDSTGAFTYITRQELVDTLYYLESVIDEFIYVVNDPSGETDEATLYITIIGQNDAPVANDLMATMFEEDTVIVTTERDSAFLKNDFDIDDNLNFGVTQIDSAYANPATGTYGQLSWNPDGTYLYRLNEEMDSLAEAEVVIDSFLYTIEDAFDSTDIAWFIIEITGNNDYPFPNNDTLIVTEDIIHQTPDWTLLDNDYDTDGDDIYLFSLDNETESPSATKFASFDWDSAGTFTYNRHEHSVITRGLDTLAFDDIFTDSIPYIISDNYGVQSEAVLRLIVYGVNDAPITERDFNFLNENTTQISSKDNNFILENDFDVDRRDTIQILNIKGEETDSVMGTFGYLKWTNEGHYTYYNIYEATDSLFANERVYDLFPYIVIDKQGATTTDTLEITILGINDTPRAFNDSVIIYEDERSFELLANENGLLENDIDVDGDQLTVRISGEVQIDDGTFGTLWLYEDGSVNYDLNAELDTLSSDEVLTEEFIYNITDPSGRTSRAKLVITIIGNNDAPVAIDDFISIIEDIDSIVAPVGDENALLFHDYDIDKDNIEIIQINEDIDSPTLNAYGELIWETTGGYVFQTNRDETDKLAEGDTVYDAFDYIVSDPFDGKDTARLLIEIIGVNDPPVALTDKYITYDIDPVVITKEDPNDILDNDFDVDGDTSRIILVDASPNVALFGNYGVFNWNEDGSFTYKPDSALAVALRPDEISIEEFEYTLADELDATDTSIIQFSIVGINNAPIAKNDTLYMQEDDPIGKLDDGTTLFNDIDPDRDTLYVSRIEDNTNGTISTKYGDLIWQPNGTVEFHPDREIIDQLGPGQNIFEEYKYTVVDEAGATAEAEIIVYIIGENDPIIAVNDTDTLKEDSYTRVDVLANDTDPDNEFEGNLAKSPVTIINYPHHGTAKVNTFNGVISYFPVENFFGQDSLEYRVCDAEGLCSEAWVFFTVEPVNDPPVATHLILKTDVDVPVSFNLFNQVNDIDDGIDPESLNYDYEDPNLSHTDSIFTYTPDTGFIGRDEFIYWLFDYAGDSAVVIVNVLIPDGGEGAQDDYATTNENIPIVVDILANDTINGFEANKLSVDIIIYAKNGLATYDPVNHILNYEPAYNFNGFDSLTYLVESEEGIWDFATVYITVEPINSPIIANDDAVTNFVNQERQIPILVNDLDEDDGINWASVEILTDVAHGTTNYDSLTGIVSYVPNQDYLGSDYFVYRVCDLDSINTSCDTAEVFILVKSKFDGLFAQNDNYETAENTQLLINNPHPVANDEGDIDLNSFTIITNPQNGSYTLNEANKVITYTPNDNYFGPDWITYQVCDEDTSCDYAEINIWVNEVNTPPVAGDDYFIVTKNIEKRLSILSNDFDFDGTLDWSTLDTITGPTKGSLRIDRNTGTILYHPDVNTAEDKFTYTICDDEGACTTASVTIIVDLGSTILYNQVTYEDTPDTILITDAFAPYNMDFNVYEVVEITGPAIGSWESIENNTKIVYTPSLDSTGADYYNLVLYSAGVDSADLRVNVTIIPVNDAPVAVSDTIIWPTDADSIAITFDQILQNDYDVDGDSIFLSEGAIDFGDSLHVVFNVDSTITVWADTIFWCDSWFTYQISDPDKATGTGLVYIMPELEGIFAITDSVVVDENSSNHEFNVIANDIFKDNQECTIDTIIVVTPPVNGIAESTAANTIMYRSNDHYYGLDSLQYLLVDIWGQTDSTWVIIDVIQRNTPPVAQNDEVVNDFGASLTICILDNDYDPDPDGFLDTLRLVLTEEPLSGTIVFDTDSGCIVYTPFELTCEGDAFSYMIFDNEGDSATATVTISLPAEAPLFAVTDTVRTWPTVAEAFNVLTNDGGYFLPYVTSFTQPEFGIVEQTGDSTFVYYPNNDFVGKDSMTYVLESPCGNTVTGYVIFLIEELRVPEIISPNSDGRNDVLIIDGIEYFPESLLQIYNRLGHLVYQSKGYQNDWGGYSNQGSFGGDKPLPSGNYFYVLTYNEGRNKQAGSIYVFR